MNYCKYCKNKEYCETYGTNCDYFVEQFQPIEELTEQMLDEIHKRNYEIKHKHFMTEEKLSEDEWIEMETIDILTADGKL